MKITIKTTKSDFEIEVEGRENIIPILESFVSQLKFRVKVKEKVKKTVQFSRESASVIKMFEIVNPSVDILYNRKSERMAAERLLKKWSLAQIKAVVSILPEMNAEKYSKGKSITPSQLENNLGYVKAFIEQREKDKKPNIISV
jgi:hypothetical protein